MFLRSLGTEQSQGLGGDKRADGQTGRRGSFKKIRKKKEKEKYRMRKRNEMKA